MGRTFALVALLSGGCALFSNSGATAKMQRGFTVASQRAALAEARVEELEERLQRVESRLTTEGAAGGEVDSDLLREVAALRAAVEELRFASDSVRTDLDDYVTGQETRQLYDERRLTALEELLGVMAPPRGGGPTEPVVDTPPEDSTPDSAPESDETPAVDPTPDPVDNATPTTTAAPSSDAAKQLALAEQRMAEGQQAVARNILERLLAEDPEGDLAPELRYRVAETLYNEGEFREAARAFQVVTDKHAGSDWTPWAMFRIGECFVGMGRPDAAEAFFDGVVRNFPGSEAAKEAAKMIDR